MSGRWAITYNRDATVAAVKDYYKFLTDMYLDEDVVQHPPADGWPNIDNLACMGKTDEVLDLLRHLPYVRQDDDDHGGGDGTQVFPHCKFADWQEIAQSAGGGDDPEEGENLRVCCEPVELVDNIPDSVIGLTYGERDNSMFLLDTEHGTVHWYECDGKYIKNNFENAAGPEWVRAVTDVDDPYDWDDIEEEEQEWRAEHPAWSIKDFFAILKGQFRDLKYVPVSNRIVYSTRKHDDATDRGGLLPAVQKIYRSHGWPNREAYDKAACLKEVKRFVCEDFPDYAYLYENGEEEGEA